MAPIGKINIEFVRLMCYNFNDVLYVGVLYILPLRLDYMKISK